MTPGTNRDRQLTSRRRASCASSRDGPSKDSLLLSHTTGPDVLNSAALNSQRYRTADALYVGVTPDIEALQSPLLNATAMTRATATHQHAFSLPAHPQGLCEPFTRLLHAKRPEQFVVSTLR